MASHKEYIEDNVKQPLVPSTLSPSLLEIIQENTEVLCIPSTNLANSRSTEVRVFTFTVFFFIGERRCVGA